MPYTIDYSTSSKTAIVVNDGTIDTTTSIGLIGKNYTRFGETLNENMLKLLENFANDSAPANPTEGQLWYDNGNSALKIYDNGTQLTLDILILFVTTHNLAINLFTKAQS